MLADPLNASQCELTALLCRGLSRLAVAAHGSDDLLDNLLVELRHELRGDLHDRDRFSTLIDAIEQRIKALDLHGDRTEQLRQALRRLIASIQQLRPDGALERMRTAVQGAHAPALASLLDEVAAHHERLLPEISFRSSRWPRWFSRGTSASDSDIAMVDTRAVGPTGSVPADVQRMLEELLRQIEPPAAARDNYQQALDRLSAGLEWEALAALVEDVCLVVVAAMESDRGEYQQFLRMLNQRLVDAHRSLLLTRETGRQRRASNERLQRDVEGQVAAMQAGVAGATSMTALRNEVTERLDSIVHSLATHRHDEEDREAALRQQLELLTIRVHEMETESARIEQRMAEQRRLALVDILTQLPNRQAYEERLQEEWVRSAHCERSLMLALCDVDNFKSINDSYGHLAGDKVLRVIARTLSSRLRRTDFCARYGGEEFVVLMPETTPENALDILEQLRQAVADCPFHFRAEPVTVTLSAGLAVVSPGDNPGRIFQRADEALYRAKQAGRNRCVLAGTEAVVI